MLCLLQAAVRNKLFRSFEEVADGKQFNAPKKFESDDALAVFQQHEIKPLILAAHKADRLPNMVPLLDRIFVVLPEESVYNTDVLNVLEPLARITDDCRTDDSLSRTLNTTLAVWLQPLQLALKKDDPDSTHTSVQSSSAAKASMQQKGVSALQPSDKSQGPTTTTQVCKTYHLSCCCYDILPVHMVKSSSRLLSA